jgi:hypothetical protein
MFDWVFWSAVLASLALVVIMIKSIRVKLSEEKQEARSLAERVARQRWYVKGVSIFKPKKMALWLDQNGWQEKEVEYNKHRLIQGGALLILSSADNQRQPLVIVIRPEHPSLEALGRLSFLDIVGFEFVRQPLECALPNEPCAYLMLKT